MIERVSKISSWGGEYQGAYRVSPGGELRKVRLHTRDKAVAVRRLRAIVAEAQQESVGLIPPASQRSAAQRPLVDHLVDFTAELASLGRDSMYVRCVGWRLRKLFQACSWSLISDVSSSGFASWRMTCGLSPKSRNDYLADLQHFVSWLVRGGRLANDPLGTIERVDTSRCEQYRRAFSHDELQRVLDVSGDRAVPYLVAAMTGLRRKELAALRWDDVVVSDAGTYVVVRASIAKNARRARIDLHPDAAAALAFLRRDSSGPLVFGRRGLPDVAVLKSDLAAANIPFQDGLGRRLDFHSFRDTWATMLRCRGVDRLLVKQLMRHSDLKLTEKYTDDGQLPTAAAVQSLSGFKLNFCTLPASPTGQKQSLAVPPCPSQNDHKNIVNSGDCHSLAPAVTNSQNGSENWGTRIRT